MLSYIVTHHFNFQDPDTVCYDLKYALRLCAEHGHKRACVHIYTTMGLYEEAVDLALKVKYSYVAVFVMKKIEKK